MPTTQFRQPRGILAGFHADYPDLDVPELVHIGEQWAPTSYAIIEHVHSVWELTFQISGETRWDACWNDGTVSPYTLLPGSFCAVPPGVRHRFREPPNAAHHFFFAGVDMPVVLGRHPELAERWKPSGQASGIVFVPHAGSLLAPFRHLIREVSLTLAYRTAGICLALDALLVEATRLCELADSPAAPSRVFYHPAVLRAKEMLDHQPGRPWRLEDLARLSGLSANHLVECFTREVGVAPRQYLLQARVKQAQEMLLQSDIPITMLALELGFSSSQHFAATFKRLTGTTAVEYRKNSGGPSGSGREGSGRISS
jgi:AraC-like DNA-binding protein